MKLEETIMKNSKRILSLLLALVMLVGMFTMVASAEDLIVPATPASPKIMINYNTSRVPELGTILPHSLEEGGEFTLPGKSIDNLCWSLGNDVFEAGEVFTYENMLKIMNGDDGNFTFIAFIDEAITDEPPVYGEDKDPIIPGNKPTWKPDCDNRPTNGKYKLTVQAYVTGYYNDYNDRYHNYKNCKDRFCTYCYGGYDCDAFDYSYLFERTTYRNELYTTNTKPGYNYSYNTSKRIDAFGTGYYNAGQTVRVSAKNAYGYEFIGWYSDTNIRFTSKHSMSTTLTMPRGNAVVYAVFAPVNGYYNDCTVTVAPKLTTSHVAYLKGYGKGEFRPDNKMTRAEFAVLLYRLLDQNTVKAYYSSANAFSDVASDAWYNEAVSTLANAGVIGKATTYRPTEYITRAEMISMLANFYTNTTATKKYTTSYRDVPKNYWAYDEISMAQAMGWIKGYGASTFLPEATITRAEVAAVMNRVLGRTNCKTVDTKNYIDNPTDAWFYQDVVEATIAH